jgi:hypothetical protein
MSDVYCAFTGTVPDEADLPLDHPLEDEELSDLPVGWTRVTVQTREPNSDWDAIIAVEESMTKQVVETLPKAQRKSALPAVRVQIAAQFAALKAQTAPYLIQTSVFHVSPGADGTEQAQGFAKLQELLGADGERAADAEAKSSEPEGSEDSDESV